MQATDPPLAKLVTVFATPSGFTNFTFHLIQHLLRVTLVSFDQIIASEFDHLKRSWNSRQHPNVLLFCDCPERGIVETYLKTKGRAVVLLDDPLAIAAFLVAKGNMSPTWAVRTAEQTITAIADLVQRDHVLVIERRHKMTATEFLKTVAGFFCFDLSDPQIEIILRTLLRPPASPEISLEELYLQNWPNAASMAAVSSAPEFKQFSSLLQQMRQRLTIVAPDTLEWPYWMFISTESPETGFLGSVDLTGPARCILYGPYLCLPVGEWHLKAAIKITNNFSGNHLAVDVFQANVLASSTFALPTEGHFLLTTKFSVNEPRRAIELRFMLVQGAIEGTLTLKEVTISRQAT